MLTVNEPYNKANSENGGVENEMHKSKTIEFLFAETQLSFVKYKEGDTGQHVIKYDVMNNMKPWNYRTEKKRS